MGKDEIIQKLYERIERQTRKWFTIGFALGMMASLLFILLVLTLKSC